MITMTLHEDGSLHLDGPGNDVLATYAALTCDQWSGMVKPERVHVHHGAVPAVVLTAFRAGETVRLYMPVSDHMGPWISVTR